MPFPPYRAGINPRDGLPEDPVADPALDRFILGYAYSPGRGIVTVYEQAAGRFTDERLAALVEGPLKNAPDDTGLWTFGDGSPQWVDAFLGWTVNHDGSTSGVYDHAQMIDIHIEEYGRDFANDQDAAEAAYEDIGFNVEGAWYGTSTPLVLHRLCRACGSEGDHGNPCRVADPSKR